MPTTTPPPPTPAPGRRPPLPLGARPAHPPPFALPGSHFLASLLWLAAGAAGLIVVAPELARGGFLDPRVFAVVHAFTLGVITTGIFGALYQMFPPLLGATLRSVRVAGVGFALLTAGTLILVAGLWRAAPYLQACGWTLVSGAIGCVSWNLLPQRRKAVQGRITGLYISGGHSALGFALLLAGARIGEGLGWWQIDRLGMLSAHFHLAALGFATLTAVGVGSRIVPMFLGTDGAPEWPLRWIGPLGGIGLLTLSVGQVAHLRPATLIGAALLAAAMVLYLALVVGYYRRRSRPVDPALLHLAAAYAGLAATVVAGIALLWTTGAALQRGVAAYVALAVLGWLVMLMVGVYYRVIPFLTWLNLAGSAAARRDPGGLMHRRLAWVSFSALVGGVASLVGGVWTGAPPVARAGSIGFGAGVALLLGQYARLMALVRKSRS